MEHGMTETSAVPAYVDEPTAETFTPSLLFEMHYEDPYDDPEPSIEPERMLNVLVVDDDPFIMQLLYYFMEAQPCVQRVEAVAELHEGYDRLVDAGDFDIAFIDVPIPPTPSIDMMRSFRAWEATRPQGSARRRMRAIGMADRDDALTSRGCRAAGYDTVVPKGLKASSLKRLLRCALS